MKRVIISSLYPPHVRGGAERIAVQRVADYQRAGDEVIVIALQPWAGRPSLQPTRTEQDGIVVYRWFALNIFSYINIGRHRFWQRLIWHAIDIINPHSRSVMERLLRQLKPDEVEVHIAKGLGYSIFAAIRSTGVPWRLVLHDVQYVVPSGLLLIGQEGILRSGWCRLYARLTRRLIGSPTEVLSPSRWLMDFYTARGFFAHSKPVIKLAFGARSIVKMLNLMPVGDPVRLLFVGQLEPHKGIEWLIQQLQQHEFKIPNYRVGAGFRCDIVGDGSQLAAVKQMVADDLRFTVWGRLAPEKLGEVFNRSDFTVVPSRCYENSPTIIVESLQAGVPVVASRVGGIPELVIDGINGWLIDPPTP